MSSLTLYDMGAELVQIQTALESFEEMEPAEAEALLQAAITEYLGQGAVVKKIDGYCGYIQTLDSMADSIKAEEQRLAARRKARENMATRLKEALFMFLETSGRERVEGALFTASVQASPPAVEVVDASIVPDEYYVPQDPKLDKARAKADMQAGKEIPGLTLTKGKHLRVR